MDRDELLILAASHIASGIVEKAYSMVRGSPAQQAAADHVAELSLSIARKIEEGTKKRDPGAARSLDELTDAELQAIVRKGRPAEPETGSA